MVLEQWETAQAHSAQARCSCSAEETGKKISSSAARKQKCKDVFVLQLGGEIADWMTEEAAGER